MPKIKNPPEVVILGAAAVDRIARVKELPPADGIAFADQFQTFAGGSGGNVAVALARLGYAVRFLGVLGDDEGGRMLLEAFHEAGVDTTCTQVMKGEQSAACFIAVDSRGQRMIFALGGVALVQEANQVSPDWLRNARVLYIADAFQEVALAAMAGLGKHTRVIFNPGGLMVSAGMDFLRPFLERTDGLILNRVEAESLVKGVDLEQICLELSRIGPRVILLTLGNQGVMVTSEGATCHVPAAAGVDVVDTTGAGDAFSAGVVAGVLEGLSWQEAASLGCELAAVKIRHFGSRTGLPEHAWLQARLATRTGKECEVTL